MLKDDYHVIQFAQKDLTLQVPKPLKRVERMNKDETFSALVAWASAKESLKLLKPSWPPTLRVVSTILDSIR